MGGGIALISGEDRGRKALEFSRRFNSLESSEVGDRVMLFVQLQVNELKLRKEWMVIDIVVAANLTIAVNIIVRKDFGLSKLKSMCYGLFQKNPFEVNPSFREALHNNAKFRASARKLVPLFRAEIARG